jgi:hypothetical protein
VITSNLAFGEWVQVLWDEKLTTALLDRLGHCSDILTTQGLPIGPRGPRKKGVVTRQRSDYTMAQVFIFPLSNCPFFLYHYQWGIYGPQCKSRAWPESWSIGCHPRLRSAPAALHTHLT